MKTTKIISTVAIAIISTTALGVPRIIQVPAKPAPGHTTPAKKKTTPGKTNPTPTTHAPGPQETVSMKSLSSEKENIKKEIKSGLSNSFVFTFSIEGTKNTLTPNSDCKDEDKAKVTALQAKNITGMLKFLPQGKLPGVVSLSSPFATDSDGGVVLEVSGNKAQATIVALGTLDGTAGTDSFAELRATLTGIGTRSSDDSNDYSKVSLVKPRIFYYINVDNQDANKGCKITADLGDSATIKITPKPAGAVATTASSTRADTTTAGTTPASTTASGTTPATGTQTPATTGSTQTPAGTQGTTGTQTPASTASTQGTSGGQQAVTAAAPAAAAAAPAAPAATPPKKPGGNVMGCSVGNDPSWMLMVFTTLVALRRRRKASYQVSKL